MAELKDKKCIVCGALVAWEGRLPCACAEHRYHEVFEAYDKARLTKRAVDLRQRVRRKNKKVRGANH